MFTTVFHSLTRSASGLLLLAVLSVFSGCASYQLGAPTALPFKTIYVRPASNASFAPQAQAIVSSQVRQQLIRDGRLSLVNDEDAADAVLQVQLASYQRSTGARSSTDTVLAKDFTLSLSAEISLYHAQQGDFLFKQRSVTGRAKAYTDNPYAADTALNTQAYQQSEYQAMPLLARDLGRQIADQVLGAW